MEPQESIKASDEEKIFNTENEGYNEPKEVQQETEENEEKSLSLREDSAAFSIKKEDYRIAEDILKEYPSSLWFEDDDRYVLLYKMPTNLDMDVIYNYSILGIMAELTTNIRRLKRNNENGPREFIGKIDDNLNPLPDILLPFDDEKFIDLRELEDKDKATGLYKHLYLVRNQYNDVSIKEIADFINLHVFDYALPQNEVDDIVKKINSLNFKNTDSHKVYKTFDEFEEKQVEWLFYPYIPLGAITILAGDPGCGKSHLSVSFASIVSNGGRFPFEDENTPQQEPSMVVMQNGEDGIEDVIKPRLTRAGANHENVGVIVEEDEVFTLSDLEKLELVLEYKRPKLVIFDPIQRYLGNINPNSLVECTNMLKGVSKLAQKYSCAILVIMHLNKGQNKGIYKLNGSVGLPGTARSVLMVRDLEDTEDKALVQIKSNLAKKGMAIIFEITDKGVVFKEQVPESSLNVSNEKGTKISQKDIAKDFIIEILKNGELESKVIKDEALNNSIAPATLERAKAELSCIKSFQRDKKWFWKLVEETSDNHLLNDDNKEI